MEEIIVAEKTPLGNVTKSVLYESCVFLPKGDKGGYRIKTKHHKSLSTISNNT